ncbi:RES domain-containing protein [Caballeronia zhejiangensis]|uniref:RES domain-containing protein n=1 Tax=Caballeronia zhejiangensis TaxID=871203 RepID=UPI001EF60782|nr:RES domain-containing protein [Caballeronia zhejiangensis]MCG7400584.1 RES domain-containing protein [Caballeronia zhejiangensis]
MGQLYDFAWNLVDDPEWAHFFFVEAPTDARRPAKIRKTALRYIFQHIVNRRELACMLLAEAKRVLMQRPHAKTIVIDSLQVSMAHQRPPDAPLLDEQQIDRCIARLESFDLKNTAFDTVMREVNTLLRGVGTHITNPVAGASYFRARTMESRPTFVSELFAPPAEYVSDYQRCNPPGKPMLYCCDNAGVALLEVGAKVGDVAYLGTWEVQGPLTTFSMPPGPLPGQNAAAFRKLSKYIDDKFTEPIEHALSHRYMISAAFSVLYANGRLDPANPQIENPLAGVFYRSVKDRRAENVALDVDEARKKLGLYAACEVEIIGEAADGRLNLRAKAVAERVRVKASLWGETKLAWKTDDRTLELFSRFMLRRSANTTLSFEHLYFPELFEPGIVPL